MRSWIHLSKGRVLRQAHVNLPSLGGLKEDELGRKGFSGRVAELYRRNEPTAWTRLEGNLRPWDIDGLRLDPSDQTDANGGPLRIFFNDEVSVWVSRRRQPMPFTFRNVTGDEVYFIHEGTGTIDTEFGPIPYEPGDWIVLPKGVTYRVLPDGERNYFMIVESVGEIEFADFGPLGRHAPFDPALVFVPSPRVEEPTREPSGREWEVRIKHAAEYTSLFYPFDPLDVYGWKGDLFPIKLNIRDYRPVTSDRIHIMPSAYCLFKASGFIICNFLPRPAEGDAEAERVPPFHRNIDYDEMLFAHSGGSINSSFEPASFFLTPQGIHHGLSDEFSQLVRKTWKKHDYYDYKLIAVETERPLKVSPEASGVARLGSQINNTVAARP
jgi:homogentisate 1,2-dioxygenase